MTTIAIDTELKIETFQINKAALILRAINHKLRQQMLQLMHRNGKINVTTLYCELRLEQSIASQHLAILRKAGFVYTVREGKSIFYSVNYKRLDHLHEIIGNLMKS